MDGLKFAAVGRYLTQSISLTYGVMPSGKP